MSFPRYPEYKESGVEWFGEIPSHWEAARTRALGYFSASGIDKKWDNTELAVRMFNYVDVYKNQNKTLSFDEALMETTASNEKVKAHSVKKGDLLFTPSSETADDIGHAAVVLNVPNNVVYSYHLIRFRPKDHLCSDFLKYFFNSKLVRAYFESVCTGTTRMVLVREDFKNLWITFPPKEEQKIIASFLNQETVKIDALITEQEKLIELLRKKRQAVISHAVTKGFSPSVMLKESGVDWLGEIPEHWSQIRLKYIITTWKGVAFKAELFCDEGVRVVKASDIKSLTIRDSDVCLPFDLAVSYPKLRSGDVIISTVGSGPDVLNSAVGQIGVIPEALDGCLLNQNTVVLRSDEKKLKQDFLTFILQSSAFRSHLNIIAHGTANQSSINVSDILQFNSPLPPVDEQSKIVSLIENETSHIDGLISSVTQGIKLLQERRSALVSAAVTGQIDVRKVAAEMEPA